MEDGGYGNSAADLKTGDPMAIRRPGGMDVKVN